MSPIKNVFKRLKELMENFSISTYIAYPFSASHILSETCKEYILEGSEGIAFVKKGTKKNNM
jgi:hypothetical protein